MRGHRRRQLARGGDAVGQFDPVQPFERPVDRRVVALDHLGAAAAVGLGDRILDPRDRLVARQHAGDREEAGLQHDIDPAREARVAGDPAGVDHVDVDALGEDLLLDRARQRVPDLVGRVPAVEQQRRAGRCPAEHVDLVEQPELVAADEARVLHEVRRPDRPRPEAQVRHGLRARLLRVVHEVALRVQVLLRAEDLDRVLVRPDRAVRPESEEDRADRVGRFDVERRVVGQARPRDVVVDADGEPAPRPLARELGEHARDHARRELLRRQAVAAARHPRHDPLVVLLRLGQRGDDVQEQRLADRARLLRPVQHGDPAHARGQRVEQRSRRERPVQAQLHHPDPLALGGERRDRLADGLRARAHHDDHAVGVGVPAVLDEVHAAAGALPEPGHRVLDHVRDAGVERVHRLARLEVDVGVLRGAADERPLRATAPGRDARARAPRAPAHAGRRRRASRSCSARATCGTRRRSARTARASRAWRPAPPAPGRGPPAPTPTRAARTRSGAPPSRPSGRRRSTGPAPPATAPRRASRRRSARRRSCTCSGSSAAGPATR